MKRLITVLIPVLIMSAGVYADGCGIPTPDYKTVVTNVNKLYSEQNQQQIMQGQGYATAEGGDASADAVALSGNSSSDVSANISSTSISEYETRTPPLSVFPSYLPYWNHGGWGTVKAYFPNGPNNDNWEYEQIFDPNNPGDIGQLRGVIESLSYDGPFEVLGGILNGVGAIFGGPDNFHHGRGFEIANSLARNRRPKGKPLFVFYNSNVDRNFLRDAGYAYVGKVSLEGKINRNWDQVYNAAVAETLPWDVDILVVSGGMKGVTVGSNIAFPGAAGAYSQTNYSVSLLGSVSSGITEGKGEAVLSADGFRFWPGAVDRRRIPKAFYESLHASRTTKIGQRPEESTVQEAAPQKVTPVITIIKEPDVRGIEVSRQLYDMAGFDENQLVEYTIKK